MRGRSVSPIVRDDRPAALQADAFAGMVVVRSMLGIGYTQAMKFGRIKRQHGRVGGLDAILDRIIKRCPHVSRIVPGRIKVRRGKSGASFKIQYPTPAGLKCIYIGTGTAQEVFLICSNATAAANWLVNEGIAKVDAEKEST